MFVLIFFAFLGGIVTVLSPCILPILPIVLSGSVGNKWRPVGVITGFIASFTFFTLALSTIVRATGIPSDSLRLFAVFTVLLFGVLMLLPQGQLWLERLFSRLVKFVPVGKTHSSRGSQADNSGGFLAGLLIGVSLGLVWAPCVGPILASVITLAATSSVSLAAVFITVAYSLGTALPLLVLMLGGQQLMARVPVVARQSQRIQQVFGIVMIVTAVAIWRGWDRQFQTFILDRFPEYGVGLTQIEDNKAVQDQLDQLQDAASNDERTDMLDFMQQQMPMAPGFEGGTQWLNSDPLTLEELKGKVVLVDFWTYSCINCIRTLPYVTGWYEKYQEQGFVVVGVHTPEFEFEKKTTNVRKAIDEFDINYPVVQDNDYRIWRAYNNRYWPAHYFLDAEGRVRHTHFGEGEYAESERVIQELLAEVGTMDAASELSVLDRPAHQNESRTPETYLGFNRMERFANQSVARNRPVKYELPQDLSFNYWAFGGEWEVDGERSVAVGDAALQLRFSSKDVHLVMSPTGDQQSGQVTVYLNGELVTEDMAGEDVGPDGTITVDQDHLYTILRLPQAGEHTLRLEFEPGIAVYAFTFG